MAKSTVTPAGETPARDPFAVGSLVRHKVSGMIMLVIENLNDDTFKAVVVHATSGEPFGFVGKPWVKAYSEPFRGSVTLTED